MDELTERLTANQPIVVGGTDPTVEELHKRTGEMGYVLVKFIQTRGGTELGFPLDREAVDLSTADFGNGTGAVHVEGKLILNGDPVRCIADIDLAVLKGTGRLVIEESWFCPNVVERVAAMGYEARSYLLNCTVNPTKRSLLAGLRPAHLAYIVSNQDRIIYGGVMGSADEPPEGVCIVVRADSFAEADAMARADPYGQAYSDICVSEFQQRIPEKYPGQLAEILDALAAVAKKTTK